MNEIPTFLATLSLLVRDGRVLLFDKIQKIGAGCKNAPGGKLEEGENHRDAAVRELEEECGIKGNPVSMEYVAWLTFHNAGKFNVIVYTYLVRDWEGEPQETKELKNPHWFAFDQMPFGEMLQADAKWMPEVLKGKRIIGEFWYNPGTEKTGPNQMILERHEVSEVETLSE